MITPKQAGFRMPAEWERHEATWIAWPHNKADWPGRFAPIPWVYCEIVRNLAEGELVRILSESDQATHRAKRMLEKSGANLSAVEFFQIPTNRVWIRDYGPLFVRNEHGEVAITNWVFNAWAKYNDWQFDNSVNPIVAERLRLRSWDTETVLEGGSIDVNGAGTLMTTEECLLSSIQERNPGLGRREIERKLSDFLGVNRVVWLADGVEGDDTHGHVDDLARFVGTDVVVIAQETNQRDANYERLKRNREILQQTGFETISLPMPNPVTFNGHRLPASYANFYIGNECVLVPTFNDPNDRIALNTLAEVFPTRRVSGIHATELVWGLGTLHCLTQQQPAAS